MVEAVVRGRVIENWEGQDEPVHLKTIRDRLLQDERRSGRLLGLYGEILKAGSVVVDGGDDQMELRLSGLVVEDGGRVRVYNRVYGEVFNQDWITQELGKLRPYAEGIAAWLGSGEVDESRLLQGQALEEALSWGVGKSLGDEDYRYLQASQGFALREEREAKAILEGAQRRSQRLIAIGKGVLVASFVGAMVVGVVAFEMWRDLRQAQNIVNLERDSARVLSRQPVVNVALGGLQKGNAVTEAMELVDRLRGFISAKAPVEDYPAFNPLLALNNAVFSGQYEHQELRGHQSIVSSVSFSPDGGYIATGSWDGTARVWSRSGELVQELRGHQGYVESVSFSLDGEYIATGSRDGTARVWSRSGELVQELRGHQGYVESVSFSPDGEYIATGSRDGTARLWSRSGELVQELRGHQDSVESVSFSPDGEYIATGSRDNTARLWSRSGELVQELRGHQDSVESVSFSPDGGVYRHGL